MNKYIFSSLVLLLIASCSDTYSDFQAVEDLKWEKSDVKTFEVDITENGNYDLFFAMRHLTGYPFTTIKVLISQITPDGNEFTKEAEFLVANEKGKYKGDVTGQFWDIEDVFSENTPLKKGKYTFKISHTMNNNPVILVIDIGLIIRKSK